VNEVELRLLQVALKSGNFAKEPLLSEASNIREVRGRESRIGQCVVRPVVF
jgi:hypothetical protein